MSSMSNYRVADQVPAAVQKDLAHLDTLTQTLLFNRGITTKDAAEKFLNPSYDEHLHDPWLLA